MNEIYVHILMLNYYYLLNLRSILNIQLNYQKIAEDVLHLKSIVNAEKHVVSSAGSGTFALLLNDPSNSVPSQNAFYCVNISPNLSQSFASIGRIGDKVKIYSFQLRCLVE